MTAPLIAAELFDRYVAALDEAAPSGPNLEYDADFMALEQAAVGKAEQQFGDTIIPAEEPEWRTVYDLSDGLSTRTRDLRVATYRTISSTRLRGFNGFVEGLSIIGSMLETLWPSVHPELDSDDSEPATMRLNSLAPLVASTFIEKLRSTPLTGGPAALRVRDVELAFGKNVATHDGEALPSADQVGAALAAITADQPGLAETLTNAQLLLQNIIDTIKAQGAANAAPDFDSLSRLLKTVSNAATTATGGNVEISGDSADAGGLIAPVGAVRSAGTGTGELRSREDAIRALDAVCDWIARNEPTNPAPLLIKRAKRVMTKSFLDIIRDLAPDSIGRVLEMVGDPEEN
ncbi:type VI secretion system protein TssA [soil metagenome]